MMEKIPLTMMDYIQFYSSGVLLFGVGLVIDIALIYLWTKWIDRIYTRKNSKNTYKIV